MFCVMNTTTCQILGKMLREDTGRVLIDGGDYHGRHFESRRKIKSFAKLPYAKLAFMAGDEPVVLKNTYLALAEFLTYSPDMTRLFRKSVSNQFSVYEIEKFADETSECKHECCRLGGNSHNMDDCTLDSAIQFETFSRDDKTYVILQIHGGCDSRWGYTLPRVFEIEGAMEFLSEIIQIGGCCSCGRWSLSGDMAQGEGFEPKYEADFGYPTCWKPDGNKLKCTKCKETVSLG